ncbi:MAG: RtcB family protein, partial [Parcubacteria group bacterium]
MQLERITDYSWRIPKHGAMRVDGIVYASRKMLDAIRLDESLQQVANVATLPGIVGASLAMPDIHWGYGFPIGGVAAFDERSGVVSPGGVGYDVNCLPNYSMISDGYGCKRPIESFECLAVKPDVKCLADGHEMVSVSIGRFLKRKVNEQLIRLTTDSGRILDVTAEHPILTPQGMKSAGNLTQGEKVAVSHFEGVLFSEPSEEIIVDEKDIVQALHILGKEGAGNSVPQILKFVRSINLLPLRFNSHQLPHLLRVIGYLFGDGTLYMDTSRSRLRAAFYGDREDLETLRESVRSIGFTPSRIYSRNRRHSIRTAYDSYSFERCEEHFYVGSSAFGVLMSVLGVPVGKRVSEFYGVPKWIRRAPLWQKRIFLAALFGAELSTPSTLTGHDYNFYCPILDMNKRKEVVRNGKMFLDQLSAMLSEFDIETKAISIRKEFTNKNGDESYRLRLILSNKSKNLINLYERIGYECNRHRQARASYAVAYLKFKERHLVLREKLADDIHAYARMTGTNGSAVHAVFDQCAPNHHFVSRSIKGRSSRVRVGDGFQTFREFVDGCTDGLGDSGCVWEPIISVDKEPYDGYVYDFTVNHPSHNFVADGVVVSNCGVRLLTTNLMASEVKDKMRQIVHQLFRDIPTGVGAHHKDFKLSPDDEHQVLKKGARWAVE